MFIELDTGGVARRPWLRPSKRREVTTMDLDHDENDKLQGLSEGLGSLSAGLVEMFERREVTGCEFAASREKAWWPGHGREWHLAGAGRAPDAYPPSTCMLPTSIRLVAILTPARRADALTFPRPLSRSRRGCSMPRRRLSCPRWSTRSASSTTTRRACARSRPSTAGRSRRCGASFGELERPRTRKQTRKSRSRPPAPAARPPTASPPAAKSHRIPCARCVQAAAEAADVPDAGLCVHPSNAVNSDAGPFRAAVRHIVAVCLSSGAPAPPADCREGVPPLEPQPAFEAMPYDAPALAKVRAALLPAERALAKLVERGANPY